VEIQPRLAGLAARSVAANGFGARFAVVAADVRQTGLVPAAAFDLVASNPPFRPLGKGVLPPHTERSLAHHEVALTLTEWLAVAQSALRPEGRLAAIFPADRLDEMRAALGRTRIGHDPTAHGAGASRRPSQPLLLRSATVSFGHQYHDRSAAGRARTGKIFRRSARHAGEEP
jgi:tRNA1(Val) A37 N6-methylase TrmN6